MTNSDKTLVDKIGSFIQKALPSPFTIAILLTIFVFLIALLFTIPSNMGYGEYALKLLGFWEGEIVDEKKNIGLWNAGKGGLYFAFQMMLMLALGHVLALSKPISKIIDRLVLTCTSTVNSAITVTIVVILASWINWGLGLILGAVLARKIGEKFTLEKRPLNYALIGACAYISMMVWHGGISGSAPIKATEIEWSTFFSANSSVDLNNLPESIPLSETVFSNLNIFVSILLMTVMILFVRFLAKKSKNESVPSVSILNETESKFNLSGAEKLDHSKLLSIGIGSIIVFYSMYKAINLSGEYGTKFITPNYLNFTFLGLCLMMHQTFASFLKAIEKAIGGTSGILIQFPLYFGIMGIMSNSGLITEISDFFVTQSSAASFPIFTFLSAGMVNIFVPSGGGQWVVQGPIIMEAAQHLNVDYGKSIMALSYGDQITNMLQPFWALPLLGITGLKAKQILPYTLLFILVGSIVFICGLLLF